MATPPIRRYNDDWYALYFGGTFWELLGLWLMLLLQIGRFLREQAERRTRIRFLQAAIFFIGFSFLLALWRLPLGLIGYGLERSYHFATLGPGLWLMDRLRGWLFGLVGIPAVWLGYLLLERSPRRWWLWLWLASIPRVALHDRAPASPGRSRLQSLPAAAGFPSPGSAARPR